MQFIQIYINKKSIVNLVWILTKVSLIALAVESNQQNKGVNEHLSDVTQT